MSTRDATIVGSAFAVGLVIMLGPVIAIAVGALSWDVAILVQMAAIAVAWVVAQIVIARARSRGAH